jgi:serine/threonine-protein kinase RsbW
VQVSFSLTLPSDERSVPTARSLVRATLEMLGVTEAGVDDVALALTEACSNVVRHAGTVLYRVEVSMADDLCRIDVVDDGPGYQATDDGSGPDPAQQPSLFTGGRGVALIRTLVDRLDFTLNMDRGTVVSFEKQLELSPGSPLLQFTLGD